MIPAVRFWFWFAVLHLALGGQWLTAACAARVWLLMSRFPGVPVEAFVRLMLPLVDLVVGGLRELAGLAAIRVFRLRGDL